MTINFAFGEDGLIAKAQQAKELTEQATKKEQEELNSVMEKFNEIISETGDIEEPSTNEVDLEPEPEPTIPIIGEDVTGGSEFEKTTTVEEGIVIQDNNGNQFVWIPVGIYKTSSGTKTNNLSRRTFTSSGASEVSGDNAIEDHYYGEGNNYSVAYNQIEAFKNSATTYGGFYIGRYEQGEGNVCKAGVNPYTNISRDNAKSQAETMYSGNKYIVSELISSYAWDTALNYICQNNADGYILSTTASSTYGNINTEKKLKTGEYLVDKYSNICDMIGNCCEWTTEYSDVTVFPCIHRGAFYSTSNGSEIIVTEVQMMDRSFVHSDYNFI